MISFCIPTKFLFGAGALKQLHKQQLPGKKTLIVITQGKSARKHGYLAELEKQLDLAGVEHMVYDGIRPNPTKDSIMEAAAAARRENCDFITALGGGSPMDSAKVIAVMATNPGDLWDYCVKGTGKGLPIQNQPLPIVCVTTTAGTGSEADGGAVISNTETCEKYGIGDPRMFPTLSVVDPELMLSVPPAQTAYQGLDTFFHLAEGYISRTSNLFNQMFALTGIENVSKYLAISIKDGTNLEAREHMAFANTLGGFVMATGRLTSEHAMEHVLSAHYPSLPHGAGLILLCRAYFGHFISCGAVPGKFIKMAQAMGIKDANKPEDFLTALEDLLKDCGVADLKMSDFGIKANEMEQFGIEAKTVTPEMFANDPAKMTKEDCIEIYRKSYR